MVRMVKKFVKGDYNQKHCEVWIREDDFDDEYFGDVSTDYADKFVDLLNEQYETINDLISIKRKYKGQRDYLLWAMERLLPKEVFEKQKGYLKEVNDNYD